MVSVYNPARLPDIIELLHALEKQTYTNKEIVIVVEHSHLLLNELESFVNNQKLGNVTLIYTEKVLGLSGARNIGAYRAKGKIIAIIDDDAIPTVDWLERAVKTLVSDESAIGVTGPAVTLWKDTPANWVPKELGWLIGASTWYECPDICEVRHAWGMNMIFKREAFDRSSGLSELHGLKKGETEGVNRFPHEDVEFSIRVKRITGKRIIYNPDATVFHKVTSRKMTMKYFATHAYVQGFAKRMVKEIAFEKDVLDREFSLLGNILFKLIPRTFSSIFHQPRTSFRKLLLIGIVLFSLAAGYFSPFYPMVKRKTKNRLSG